MEPMTALQLDAQFRRRAAARIGADRRELLLWCNQSWASVRIAQSVSIELREEVAATRTRARQLCERSEALRQEAAALRQRAPAAAYGGMCDRTGSRDSGIAQPGFANKATAR
jgi:hypothetical protein